MREQSILEEIRAARQAHAERFGYDAAKILADLQRIEKLEKAAGRLVIDPPVRPEKESASNVS